MLIHARCHLPAELKNRHQCDQCPKRFGTKPNLMAHKRIHAGVRDYTCDQCGKSFVQKGNLDNHLLTHTAARPYVCSTCGKAFKTLVRLRKHGSVHSGISSKLLENFQSIVDKILFRYVFVNFYKSNNLYCCRFEATSVRCLRASIPRTWHPKRASQNPHRCNALHM